MRLRELLGLAGLVVLGNAEVKDGLMDRLALGVHNKKAEKARHLRGGQWWLGLEQHMYKVRWSLIRAVAEQLNGRLILLG